MSDYEKARVALKRKYETELRQLRRQVRDQSDVIIALETKVDEQSDHIERLLEYIDRQDDAAVQQTSSPDCFAQEVSDCLQAMLAVMPYGRGFLNALQRT